MSKGSFIAGLLVGIVIAGAIGFVAIQTSESNDDHDSDRAGRILQTKYEEFRSQAFLPDSETGSWALIPDTELEITTKGDSFLSLTFSAVMILHLDSSFSGACRFNISLEVAGITNKQTRVSYYHGIPGPSQIVEFSERVDIHYETDTLAIGTYSLAAYWISAFDAPGSNQLISSTASFNFTRTLSVWEISS
ncbi:MAG: hypothetical protein ACXAB4_10620 [Candidatus Hodarchaeales archaeon]|jgi:hypothetical protein